MKPLAWAGFVTASGFGASLRYLFDGLVADRVEGAFPWGTLLINASGSLLLGVLTGLGLYHALPKTVYVILGAGLCGSYTTFSTFTFETIRLVEEGARLEAARNVVGTLATCAATATAGIALAAL